METSPAEFSTLPQNPEKSLKQRKEVLWQKLLAELGETGDGLGKGIDSGILETVTVINALGLTTRQSCEGHVNWGTGAPWVDIEATGPHVENLKKKAREAWDVAIASEEKHISRKELDKVFDKAHKLKHLEKVEHLKLTAIILGYLNEFYQDRQVPADQRLILTYGSTRLESQGAAFQDLVEVDVKKQRLIKYQEEMKAFTDFLKKKYYSDETPIEPGENEASRLEKQRLELLTKKAKQFTRKNPAKSNK